MFEVTFESLMRTVVVGVLAYIGLIAFLRISGKRTLSKLNAFDLVVSVALGSTLSTILLDSSISLWEGLTAFAVLILLQYIMAAAAVHSSKFNKLIKSEPKMLYLEGEYLRGAMKKERIKEIEIMQAIRNTGLGSVDKAKAVVLETDGSLSVISDEPNTSLANVKSPVNKEEFR